MKKFITISVISAGITFGIALYVGVKIGVDLDVWKNIQEHQVERIEQMKGRGRE